MLALLGRGQWKKAELIWSGLAKPVSSNGLSETPGLVWFGLAKSGSRRESGLVVCSRKLDRSAAIKEKEK